MRSFNLQAWLAGTACLLLACSSQAQVAISTQFAGSASVLSDSERAALAAHVSEAGRQWVADLVLDGPRAIEIEIAIDNDIPRATGGSLTTGFVATIGLRSMFEQGVAAELRTGIDPNGSEADARFTFNLAYLRDELWFDPDPSLRSAPVPIDRTDAFSVILHEFGHAIAYNGWADGSGIPPATFYSTFDRWMQAGTPTVFTGPISVASWGSAPDLTTGNIHHWGNPAPGKRAGAAPPRETVRWLHGRPLPQPACHGLPSVDAPPSADRTAVKGGAPSLIDELMNGVVFFRGSRYQISALDLSVLEDLGLAIATDQDTLFEDGFEQRR